MNRSAITAALALFAAIAIFVGADPSPPETQGRKEPEFDPRIGAVGGVEDPFADGAVPDLVVLASGDARGETIPCG